MKAIRELMDPLNGSVYSASGYVLVDDGATRTIYTDGDAARLAEEWQANIEKSESVDDEDGYEKGQAYTRACNLVQPLRDEDIPDEALAALREESGLRGRLTYGW
jgi:hypothetical protein